MDLWAAYHANPAHRVHRRKILPRQNLLIGKFCAGNVRPLRIWPRGRRPDQRGGVSRRRKRLLDTKGTAACPSQPRFTRKPSPEDPRRRKYAEIQCRTANAVLFYYRSLFFRYKLYCTGLEGYARASGVPPAVPSSPLQPARCVEFSSTKKAAAGEAAHSSVSAFLHHLAANSKGACKHYDNSNKTPQRTFLLNS